MKEKKRNVLLAKIKLIFIIIILVVVLIFLYNKVYIDLLQKKNFESSIIDFSEKNKETIFSIKKIVFFSSCDSKNKSSSISNFTIENLYAYTDIALFIDNGKEETTSKNTLKNVKINNIKINKRPLLGNPNIYFKSINDFVKSGLEENNIVNNELDFTVTSEDNVNLKTPILYNNCANPITISYINQNIKTDYTMTDTTTPITYDGTLLKRCGVEISSIDASISLDIEIENNLEQKFRTTIYLDIPYEENEKSILDGSIIVKKNIDFKFYRYE